MMPSGREMKALIYCEIRCARLLMPGKPKEYDERLQEQMQNHSAEMDDMLPGLRERRDKLKAERGIYEDDDIGPSTQESDDELEELDEIISTFEMYT